MSKIKVADFYYGAVLSMLFHNGVMPALVENGDDRQVYDFTTDKSECRLFIKYRANKQDTKKPDYSSWIFAISDDKAELQKYIDEGKNLLLALVCVSSELDKSQLAILDKSQIQDILSREKTSITISRIKGEKAFRISVGGGRENSIQVKCNRFEELF